jgi:3-deoxy-manno-octulosonate cytidylyltransferase (CMP-KDO synthetase)
MNIAIAIPARYASTRFPGKPLAMIGGRSMLARVVDVAREAAGRKGIDVFVTTEDERIAAHAKELGVECVMTEASCKTGSDRVLAALKKRRKKLDFVINLQGDAPFTPPSVIRDLIETIRAEPDVQVVTPVHRLSWTALDALRAAKATTPFSGTTAVLNAQGDAVWFSKNIIPALRKEADLRKASTRSPIYQHMGLYGFRVEALEQFCALPEGAYEALEGLEQLRLLENNIPIRAVPVTLPEGRLHSGIDSPEDIARLGV